MTNEEEPIIPDFDKDILTLAEKMRAEKIPFILNDAFEAKKEENKITAATLWRHPLVESFKAHAPEFLIGLAVSGGLKYAGRLALGSFGVDLDLGSLGPIEIYSNQVATILAGSLAGIVTGAGREWFRQADAIDPNSGPLNLKDRFITRLRNPFKKVDYDKIAGSTIKGFVFGAAGSLFGQFIGDKVFDFAHGHIINISHPNVTSIPAVSEHLATSTLAPVPEASVIDHIPTTVPPGIDQLPTSTLVEPEPFIMTPLPEVTGISDISLPDGGSDWQSSSEVLKSFLGNADPTNSEIQELAGSLAKSSGIAVPEWGIDGPGFKDEHSLRAGFKLVFNDDSKGVLMKILGKRSGLF